jgi:hypothetical protein
MANAYFCNCVADKISVGLNGQIDATQVKPRALDGDINNLPMAVFPITDAVGREKGKFSAAASNTVVVNFETLRDSQATYEITVDKSVAGKDFFFYVFENTLVGQDQVGKTEGISIQAHEIVKKLIQSGTESNHSSLPIILQD